MTMQKFLRFIKQWLMAWRGNDGNIYITSANELPFWKPSKLLISRTEEYSWQVVINFYSSIISW